MTALRRVVNLINAASELFEKLSRVLVLYISDDNWVDTKTVLLDLLQNFNRDLFLALQNYKNARHLCLLLFYVAEKVIGDC
jgi:hypothetical protein